MKLGRNDLCLCGSKLKYKKCCLGKSEIKHLDEDYSFNEFIESNNSIELLKIVSLIQLLPKNHSKVVRLEIIQDSIGSIISNTKEFSNYDKFKNIIHKDFPTNFQEDPPESSFTENLIYLNGNNVVFPGISSGSTNVNQILLSTIILWENELSENTKTKIKDGAFLLLHIHNQIALKLNYKRFLYEDDDTEEINFPTNEFIKSNINLFEFTKEKIDDLYSKFDIQTDIINEFTCTPEEIKNHTGEETLLTIKPFVFYCNKYYLALPTAEMYSLNLFIRRVISESNELDILDKIYNKFINHEVVKYLGAYWNNVETNFSLTNDESIWQFDTNKFAYVYFLNNSNSNLEIEKRATEVIDNLKKETKNKDSEFLTLHFFASYEINEIETYMFKDIEGAKYQLAFSFFDFERIYTYWEIDKLSLWKYARAKERLDEKGTILAPFFSILTYYMWYISNKESFFHSDDAIPSMMSFDFSMQGEVITKADQENDKHVTFYFDDQLGLGSIPVIKTEKYAPIYTSEEIYNGDLKLVLEKYSFPIWIKCEKERDYLGKNFIDAILYWLNELHEPLNQLLLPLGKLPLELILSFDENLRDFMNGGEMIKKSKINIEFKINPQNRKIKLTIPSNIFNALHRKDNHGERILMNAVIKCFNNLLVINGINEISDDQIEKIINEYIPLSKKKMILTSNSQDNIQSFNEYIPKVRYIYSADTSIVLEENVKWLNYNLPIPEKINTVEEKIKLCDDLISSLTNQLRLRICQYNSIILLNQLMLRHEALIQKNGFKDIGLTARLECFSKFDDIIKEYKDFNSQLIKSSHSIRCLIEYVVAEPYYKDKKVNDDDTDFLLAIMSELIYYGSIKDSIKFGIDNPDMGILPSGRLGMNHDFYNNVLTKYSESLIFDEINKYEESFSSHFKDTNYLYNDNVKSVNHYYDKVDIAFENDLGISFTKIHATLIFLLEYCFSKKNSSYSCSEAHFYKILYDNSELIEKEVDSFIKFMSLETRGKMEIPKNLNEYPEIYPWRYNREYSYIRRPILKLKNEDNSFLILWSARHLDMAMENLNAIFHDGLLKVNKECKEISKLILDRNNIKGNEFRNKVHKWLNENTSLQVVPHEIKIRKSTFPNADRDYGDIDILAFDLKDSIIYSIECKNTKQVKIMYDFSSDIKNYLTKQLPKHVTRGIWLKENPIQVSEKFNIEASKFEVRSIVISSYQLPIKFIEETPIPIYSLSEIKRKKIFES
ncbi:YecA family protein [Flavobacterium sp. FlaQc-51]|uniref:YecA family protein n=1 Tax=Flavobacterium sp. FlaQc-51 TaxID=3374184 RepID=UPI0037579715